VVIRTMSKAFGLAGARIGYSVARAYLTEQIASQQIYATISRPSQAAAIAARHDSNHVQATVDLNNAAMEILVNGVQALGLDYIPSHTNFMMIDVGMDGGAVKDALYDEGYRVRSGYGMPNHIRVSTGTLEETQGLVDALDRVLSGRSVTTIDPRHASSFGIGSLYPNPVNDSCRIQISIPESGTVTLEIYDLKGRKLTTLVNSSLAAGRHEYHWSGRDILGKPAASGVYIALLRQGELAETRALNLIR
jgi:hypothetical protein